MPTHVYTNTLYLDTIIEEFKFFYKTQCNFLANYENAWRGKQSTSMQTASASKAMTILLGSLKLDSRIPVLQNTANVTENNDVRTAFD